jgi:raffinose/stachyose/melibiose transport system substrate-binding protein
MTKKNFVLLVVLLLFIAAVAGTVYVVSRDPAPTGTSGTPEPKPVVLKFWHIQNYSPTQEAIDSAVKRFEADHPGVTVEQNRMKNDAYKLSIELAFASGEAPDIFHTWGGGVLRDQMKAGLVEPLDDLFAQEGFRDRFLPGALPFCLIDGKAYCSAADLSAVLFFYNQELFAQHGIEVPKSWDELLAVCDKLQKAGVIPFALGNSELWPGCFYHVYPVVRAGGGEPAARAAALSEGAFSHPAFTKASDAARTLAGKGYFNKGFQGIKEADSRRLLFTGKAGMTLMGTWIIALASSEMPEFVEKMGCFAFPAFPDAAAGDPTGVVGGINCAFAVSSGSKQKALSKELLGYLSDAEFARAWAKTGRIPAVRGADEASFSPLTRSAFGILSQASFIQLYFDQAFPPRLGEEHKKAVSELLGLSNTAQQAAERLEKVSGELRGK